MSNITKENSRLSLHSLTEEELHLRVQWFNDPEVNRNLILREPIEYDKTVKWYKSAKSDVSRKDFIINVKSNKSIGCIGLRKIDYLNKSACFYILIGEKEFWGRGLGKEASVLLFEWAFKTLGLNKIWSNVASYNTASLSLLKKIGFTQEGYLREEEIINGKKIDLIRLGLLISDFNTTPKK